MTTKTTFTGKAVATAIVDAVEALDGLGEDATVVQIIAGENMQVVTLVVDMDYYDEAGDIRTYAWNGKNLVEAAS
jgi:hypothetical protein